MRAFERADLARCTGLAPFRAEQLDLQAVGVHRRAIDRDKRPVGTARTAAQTATDNLLAGTRHTGHEDPAAGRRNPLDLLPQLIDHRRRARKVELAASAQTQFGIFAAQLRRLLSRARQRATVDRS